jgi:hypothetical protein
MIDKAFGMREVVSEVLNDEMVMLAGGMVIFSENEDERNYNLNLFGQTVAGLMAYAMSQLLLSEDDFRILTTTINELTEMEQEAKDEN